MDVLFRMDTRHRSPADRAEIARRVAIYTRQVEQRGRIYWLRKVVHGAKWRNDEDGQMKDD